MDIVKFFVNGKLFTGLCYGSKSLVITFFDGSKFKLKTLSYIKLKHINRSCVATNYGRITPIDQLKIKNIDVIDHYMLNLSFTNNTYMSFEHDNYCACIEFPTINDTFLQFITGKCISSVTLKKLNTLYIKFYNTYNDVKVTVNGMHIFASSLYSIEGKYIKDVNTNLTKDFCDVSLSFSDNTHFILTMLYEKELNTQFAIIINRKKKHAFKRLFHKLYLFSLNNTLLQDIINLIGLTLYISL